MGISASKKLDELKEIETPLRSPKNTSQDSLPKE